MRSVLRLAIKRLPELMPLFAAMTGMTLLLTMAFGGMAGGGGYRPTILVADEAKNEASRDLVRTLSEEDGYELIEMTFEAALETVREGAASALVAIGKDYGPPSVHSGEGLVLVSIKQDAETAMIEARLGAVLSGLARKADLVATAGWYAPDGEADRSGWIQDRYLGELEARPAVRITQTGIDQKARRSDNVKGQMLGFSLMFAAYTMVFSVSQLLYDREQGTYARMLTSPLPRFAILSGYLLVPWLLGMAQMGVLFVLGEALFGLDWAGSAAALMIVSAAFVLCLNAMGMLLSTVVENTSQLSSYTPVVLTSFAMLGGCLWPLELVQSKVLLGLSVVTPHRWAMQALSSVGILGTGLRDVLPELAILGGMSVLFFCIALSRLAKRYA